ncbi:MAG: hypothetical protein F6K26_21325 [Moorea sp. SIO2I5]|nr:hypothetical protein [Moorena sp. SIO2I5]
MVFFPLGGWARALRPYGGTLIDLSVQLSPLGAIGLRPRYAIAFGAAKLIGLWPRYAIAKLNLVQMYKIKEN